MTIIVTDAGFAPDDWTGDIVPLSDVAPGVSLPPAIAVAPADDVQALAGRLDGVALIAVAFPSFADGRGFTHARTLRTLGYTGRLRAAGHVIADQYAMTRRAGFDEVAIPDDLALRQPQDQWRARADWQAHDYQARLRDTA